MRKVFIYCVCILYLSGCAHSLSTLSFVTKSSTPTTPATGTSFAKTPSLAIPSLTATPVLFHPAGSFLRIWAEEQILLDPETGNTLILNASMRKMGLSNYQQLSSDGQYFIQLSGDFDLSPSILSLPEFPDKPCSLSMKIIRIADGATVVSVPLLPSDFPESFPSQIEELYQHLTTEQAEIKNISSDEWASLWIFDRNMWLAFHQSIGQAIWAPDGTPRVAFTAAIDGPSTDVYILDVSSGNIQRVTEEITQVANFFWSPDGRRIIHQETFSLLREYHRWQWYQSPASGGEAVPLENGQRGQFLFGGINNNLAFLMELEIGRGRSNLFWMDIEDRRLVEIWPYGINGDLSAAHEGEPYANYFDIDPSGQQLMIFTLGETYQEKVILPTTYLVDWAPGAIKKLHPLSVSTRNIRFTGWPGARFIALASLGQDEGDLCMLTDNDNLQCSPNPLNAAIENRSSIDLVISSDRSFAAYSGPFGLSILTNQESIRHPEDNILTNKSVKNVTISPDSQYLVFYSQDGMQLFKRNAEGFQNIGWPIGNESTNFLKWMWEPASSLPLICW